MNQILLLLILFLLIQQISSGFLPVPGSLLFFTPLDAESGTRDIVGNFKFNRGSPLLETSKLGPLDMANASHTVSCRNCDIGFYYPIPSFHSFTFSTYFYVSGSNEKGAIAFLYGGTSKVPSKFSLLYNGKSLEIHRFGTNGAFSIGNFTIGNVIQQWRFICLTYDDPTKTLSVYDESGDLIHSEQNFPIVDSENSQLIFGYGRDDSNFFEMTRGDAMACTMIYTQVLEPYEIAQLPGVCSTKIIDQPKPWPDKNDLIGIWPLSKQYKLSVANQANAFRPENVFKPESLAIGPHGTADTAIASVAMDEPILEIHDNQLTTSENSFTIAFYIRTIADHSSGGVFEFIDSNYNSPEKAFQIYYFNDTIAITANESIVGEYRILQRKSTWTFLAFAYEASSMSLSIYSEHGLAYSPTVQIDIGENNIFNNGGFRLGYSTIAGSGLNPGDAISCFSFYSTSLNWPQIRNLQKACRFLHNSPLPGTSKLGSNNTIPINLNPPLTTVPQPGQFPWLGILETTNGTLVCSVSILDEHWVLTMASCLDGPIDNFQIKVGVHDSYSRNPFTKIHKIDKIFKSGQSKRNIALIQLNTPIDFTSQYVNDACLFDGEKLKIEYLKPQYFSGWGTNGRNKFVGKTIPRFVTGSIIEDWECQQAWNNSFDSTKVYCFKSLTQDANVPCDGDQGSALMFEGISNEDLEIKDQLVQVGLFYKRDQSCTSPGLFVDIQQFKDWISQQMACALPGSNYEPLKCPQ